MLVIYSKLTVSDADRRWIEAIRERHDPQHRLIEAHFTFVFPFDGVPADSVIAHATVAAAATAPICFRLAEAVAVKDPLGSATHLFFMPSEGADAMHALHARLYSGVLAVHRHPVLPYAPHVTVGAFDAPEDATRVAASLPAFDISGVLEGLVVAEFDGRTVEPRPELKFGG